jgi:hypothetical protein
MFLILFDQFPFCFLSMVTHSFHIALPATLNSLLQMFFGVFTVIFFRVSHSREGGNRNQHHQAARVARFH